jgi:hypothetical protein
MQDLHACAELHDPSQECRTFKDVDRYGKHIAFGDAPDVLAEPVDDNADK